MNAENPFPPIDPNQLGTGRCYFIDDLLVPYIIPRIFILTSDYMWDGDLEDVIGTEFAFNDLLMRLTAGQSCMLGEVVAYLTALPPSNSLPCDGNIYLRVDYPELYAVLHADLKIDVDHFKVPDLRQRSPKGYQAGAGLVGALQGVAEFELEEINIPQHTHINNPHGHTVDDPGHDHVVDPHSHTVTDPGHLHNIAHTHTVFARDNGLTPGVTSRMAKADGSGTNSTPTTQSQSTPNSASAGTGITLVDTTVNIQSAATGIGVDLEVIDIENWGGDDGVTIPIPLIPPVTIVQFALICR